MKLNMNIHQVAETSQNISRSEAQNNLRCNVSLTLSAIHRNVHADDSTREPVCTELVTCINATATALELPTHLAA